jgi:AraC family transcriptional regulator, 4-hydroxyphenylacetate 3-monooxygenase operon regulatory protein
MVSDRSRGTTMSKAPATPVPDGTALTLAAATRPIANIDLAAIYDRRFARDEIQYGDLGALARIMGRTPVPHRHDEFLQMHYVEKGSFDLRLELSYFRATGPAIFITPPGVPHAFTLSPDASGHVLTIRQTFLTKLLNLDEDLPPPERIVPSCIELPRREGRREARQLSLCFHLLCREMGRLDDGSQSVCTGLAHTIVAMVLRYMQGGVPGKTDAASDLARYRQFLQLVERHFRQQRPLHLFAAELGVTVWRLNDISNACGGKPPKTILRERVLREAKRYLSFSEASIKEIAAALGYSDEAYFCRTFKRNVGQTPSEFRSLARQGSNPTKVQ